MSRFKNLIRRLTCGPPEPSPVSCRHTERSLLLSADDDAARPDDLLLDLALRAAGRARTVSMDHVVRRMKQPPFYPDVWPGEHYKLLAGLMLELRPMTVVEIGTSTGLSSLAMLPFLPEGGRLTTFDILGWKAFADTVLSEADFGDGRLTQVLGDLADPAVFVAHAALLQSADLIFVDGPKDAVFEDRFLANLDRCLLPKQPVVLFDDIRLWNMLRTWRNVSRPKLDLTSFGHWSGTGLVHWIAQ